MSGNLTSLYRAPHSKIVSPPNSASTSNQIQQSWLYISRDELIEWISKWKCINRHCQSTDGKVFEARFYLLKCGHRICENCKNNERIASFRCWECETPHVLDDMTRLNEASYINNYRDELKQKGIPCTSCFEKHKKERYYPRELMYVCRRYKCSDAMDQDVEYDIYSNSEQASPTGDVEKGPIKKLTRVCLYCISDGEHSKYDVVRNKENPEKDGEEHSADPNIWLDCTLEPIDKVDGLMVTLNNKSDRMPNKLERDPWHLQMFNKSLMETIHKKMLSCFLCKEPFKSDNPHNVMLRCFQCISCEKCTPQIKHIGKCCTKRQTTTRRFNDEEGNEIHPHLYEQDFVKKRQISDDSYQGCFYCYRVHSIDYLRQFKNDKNEDSWCCLECMLEKGAQYDDVREQVFTKKMEEKAKRLSEEANH